MATNPQSSMDAEEAGPSTAPDPPPVVASAPKRRMVDADGAGVEVPDPKRPRINLNSELKGNIIRYICCSACTTVLQTLKLCGSFYNITVAHQVMSIIQTGHNLLRKAANSGMGLAASKDVKATVTSKGNIHYITYGVVTNHMVVIAKQCGLDYTKSDRGTNDHWYGVANPLFTICGAFKMRFDEIRLGVGKMPVAKRGDVTDYVDVSRFGIRPAHHILLEGATYKPERRAPMAQSLGPLTALLCSYKSAHPYKSKWTNAVIRDLSHIPNIQQAVEVIQGRRAEEVAPLIGALSDVTLLAGSRNAQRAFFPVNFLMFSCCTLEDMKWRDMHRKM